MSPSYIYSGFHSVRVVSGSEEQDLYIYIGHGEHNFTF